MSIPPSALAAVAPIFPAKNNPAPMITAPPTNIPICLDVMPIPLER